MTIWQQQNPGKCARCSVRLASYDPTLPPVCDRCTEKTGVAVQRMAAGAERLYPVHGVQCAAMVKDWKESWDLSELQELQELVSGANSGAKAVASEFADGSDSNWLLIHPESLNVNLNDEDLVEYITGEEEDYEGEDQAIWQDLVSKYASAPKRPRAAVRRTAASDQPQPGEVWEQIDEGWGRPAGERVTIEPDQTDVSIWVHFKATDRSWLIPRMNWEKSFRKVGSRTAASRTLRTADMDDMDAMSDFLDNEYDRMESPTEAVDVVGEILQTGKATDIDGALAEARKDLKKWADWINSENELSGPDAFQTSDVEAALALLEEHWNE
jgi:hypothetical protein